MHVYYIFAIEFEINILVLHCMAAILPLISYYLY